MSSAVAPSPRRKRFVATLCGRTENNLVGYAIAASAAGVSALAMSQPAEAKIVFTSVHTTIIGSVPLDVNADGISDFFFHNSGERANTGTMRYSQFVLVSGAQASNQVIGYFKGGRVASALSARVNVSSKDQFVSYAPAGMANCAVESFGTVTHGGKWFGAKNKFLGFKFLINGQTHYGWARLSIRNTGNCSLGALLTGYAYETVANKPILTGKTTGPLEDTDLLAPTVPKVVSSLGQLARGSHALSIWRREDEVVES